MPTRQTKRSAPIEASTSPLHFADRLVAAIDAAGSPTCVGLDPVLERLPSAILKDSKLPGQAEKIEAFCLGVIETLAEVGGIAAIKPQSACFERFGAAGIRALKSVIRAARKHNFVVILDAKHGDIGVTAEHYAAAAFGSSGEQPSPPHAADAVTVNAYLGFDTVEPYLSHAGHGIFVLVRTSNPGSDAVQATVLSDGRTIAGLFADHVHTLGAARRGERGLSDVGAVVGATKSGEAADLRTRMPDSPFLVPGFGAQGGTLDDIRPMLRKGAATPGELGVLVNASRSVLYPAGAGGADWKTAISEAGKSFVAELRALVP